MNQTIQRSSPSAQPAPEASALLPADEFVAPAWIAWWYRLAAFAPPVGRVATLRERERIRRSRLASILLAVQLGLIEGPVIPVVANAPNGHLVLPWLVGCIGALFVAFFCNKRGWLTLAGLLMVASIEVTVSIKILTVPGGISLGYLPQFDILIQPILISVALLAPWSAFVVAGLNIGFVLLALTVAPHAPDLVAALHNPAQVGDIFAVPIMGQILAAFFGWIIVKNLLDALKRASQAEQIAALEHAIAESRAQTEARNQHLETGIQAIVWTIQQVSNQQGRARIDLAPSHELWPIAQQLNRFLDRYQGAREDAVVLEQMRQICNRWANEIHQAREEQRPWRLPQVPQRTPLAVVLAALSAGPEARRPQSGMGDDSGRGTPWPDRLLPGH